MTTPNDDELCRRLRALKDSGLPRTGGGTISFDGKLSTYYMNPPIMVVVNPDGEAAAARIEALIAERDAAVVKANVLGPCADEFCSARVATERDNAIAEGERRATAAIVAWLRAMRFYQAAADAIERGDHLTEAKP